MNRSSLFKLLLVLVATFQSLFNVAASNNVSNTKIYLTLVNDGRYDASSDLHVSFQLESVTRFQRFEITTSNTSNNIRTNQQKDGKVDVDIIIRGGDLQPLLLPYSVKPTVRVEILDINFITVDNISGVFQGNVEPQTNNEIRFNKLHVFTDDETSAETNNYHAKLDYSLTNNSNQLSNQKSSTVSDLVAYPNPVSDGNLFLKIPESLQNNVSISICNVLGSLVKRVQTASDLSNPVHVDLSGLNPGIYFVRVQSGQTEIVKRFNINR
jgi:hypothetical protein